MSINQRYLYRIADDIDRHGMAAVEADITTVVDQAAHAGVAGTALAVLGDVTEPEMARARAFGIVATNLWLRSRVPARTSAVAAAIG